MAEMRYHLFFSGKIIQGEDPAQVRLKVARIFSADQTTLTRLFSGTPVRIKSDVDQETAARYRLTLREAGALIDIQPAHQVGKAAGTILNPASSEALTLFPPNTGSLIDCAPRVQPATIPLDENLNLAPAGADIDQSAPTLAKRFDTGDLTLGAANSGTLEDCQPKVEPAPVADISRLRLEQPEDANL